MSTIIEKLNEILTIKKNIKQAIRDKGVEMKDDTPFADYPSCIKNIETGGGDPFYEDFYNMKTNNGTDMAELFRGYKGTELDVSNLDTSNVTNMEKMFQDCIELGKLDVSNFNTFNVEEMYSMFSGCNNLTELNLSNFNTIRVRNMNSMFFGCGNLETLYLSNWAIDNTDVGDMFMFCNNLRYLYLVGCSNETISKIINDSNLPTGTWREEMRVIFCREKDRGDLEAPDGWEFSYKDDDGGGDGGDDGDDGGDGGGDYGGGDDGGDNDVDNGGEE